MQPESNSAASVTPATQYWAFRVDRNKWSVLDAELSEGRLRQGWGWDEAQDLRNMQMDQGAARNLRMLNVRKGDRILIPHLPKYGQITIAEATIDWRDGYAFSVHRELGDYGHIFPVKRLLSFQRSNGAIPASLRATFRNPCRFWRIDHLGADIEKVANLNEVDLQGASLVVERWQEQIQKLSEEQNLKGLFFERARQLTGKAEWEWLLADALQRLNPGWEVIRTGGKMEKHHGTDLLLRIPHIFGGEYYGIALQIKDYRGEIGNAPLDQIRKADVYWGERGIKILERILLITDAESKDNPSLNRAAEEKPTVRLVWGPEVANLVFRSACNFLSDPERVVPGAVASEHPENDQDL